MMLHCRTACRCLVAAVAAGTWTTGPAVAQAPEVLDEAFEQPLEPDVRTLMQWAVRDDDRTMLFAPELAVRP